MPPFADRPDAGRRLAAVLAPTYAGRDDLLVLGLPRGGVPVAAAVADALPAPLDVLVVRKLGVPGHEELAMGALASGGAWYVDDGLIARLGIPAADVSAVVTRESTELARREVAYRGQRAPLDVAGRTVLLVDDGIATGASLRVAALAVRRLGPAAVVAAVPVGPRGSAERLADVCDAVVLAHSPERFTAVGAWYADFRATTDAEVSLALASAAAPR